MIQNGGGHEGQGWQQVKQICQNVTSDWIQYQQCL